MTRNTTISDIVQTVGFWQRQEDHYVFSERTEPWFVDCVEHVMHCMDEHDSPYIYDVLYAYSVQLMQYPPDTEVAAVTKNAVILTVESCSQYPITYLIGWLAYGNMMQYAYVDAVLNNNDIVGSFHAILSDAYAMWVNEVLNHFQTIFAVKVYYAQKVH